MASPGRQSRAGRNLPVAIGVGLGLGALIIASLFVRKVAFIVLVAVVVVVALRELSNAFQERGIRFPLLPVTVGGVGMLATAYFRGEGALAATLALTAVATLVWRLADGAEGFLRDAAAGVLAAVYVPFLAGFAALLTAADHGAQRVLIFLILVVCNDTGGYAAGVLFGRHPMAPAISPKKSWEGLAGSIRMSIMFAGTDRAVANMSVPRHQQVVDAIATGDPHIARNAVDDHMREAAQNLLNRNQVEPRSA